MLTKKSRQDGRGCYCGIPIPECYLWKQYLPMLESMGLKTLFGIKKYQWKKSTNKFVAKTKIVFSKYPWDDFYQISEYFWRRELSSLPESAFLFRLSHDIPISAKIVEIGSWLGESTCLLASGLKGSDARIYAVDNFIGYVSDPLARTNIKRDCSD